jgi:hypothetical protein
MASADFCTVTTDVSTGRAARLRLFAASFFARSGQLATALGSWCSGVNLPGFRQSSHAPQAAQISPGKNANCRCTSAAFTVDLVPVGFASTCRLASTPSAFYAVSVRRLAPLALRLPSHDPSRSRTCLRLVVIMLTMSPCRYSHRGLPPHKFAPMLGAHGSVKPTPTGFACLFPPRFALRCGLPYELGFSQMLGCLKSFITQ